MATPQEFDKGDAIDTVKGWASEARSIQADLYSVANKYANPSPTSDDGVRRYRQEIYRDLTGPFNAFKKLMNDLD